MDNALIKSFEPQKKLNSKIWEKFGNSVRMEPVVRARLLELANEFIDFLDRCKVIYCILLCFW